MKNPYIFLLDVQLAFLSFQLLHYLVHIIWLHLCYFQDMIKTIDSRTYYTRLLDFQWIIGIWSPNQLAVYYLLDNQPITNGCTSRSRCSVVLGIDQNYRYDKCIDTKWSIFDISFDTLDLYYFCMGPLLQQYTHPSPIRPTACTFKNFGMGTPYVYLLTGLRMSKWPSGPTYSCICPLYECSSEPPTPPLKNFTWVLQI